MIVADDVESFYGLRPRTYVEEATKYDALLNAVKKESRIAMVVLGAATGVLGPGPLVSWLAGERSGHFPVPVLIVPGQLSDEQIDALT